MCTCNLSELVTVSARQYGKQKLFTLGPNLGILIMLKIKMPKVIYFDWSVLLYWAEYIKENHIWKFGVQEIDRIIERYQN